jgi:hypothetical protein
MAGRSSGSAELLVVGAIIFGFRSSGHRHLRSPRHAYPCLVTGRQPVPADHRAAQFEHGDRLRSRSAAELGIELVALWTILSLIFHAVPCPDNAARCGQPVTSWLE